MVHQNLLDLGHQSLLVLGHQSLLVLGHQNLEQQELETLEELDHQQRSLDQMQQNQLHNHKHPRFCNRITFQFTTA